MDMGADGVLTSWYMPPQGDAMTVVVPAEKRWFTIPIPDDQRGKLPEEYEDPAGYVRRFLSQPYRELGRSTIGGVAVQGVEVTDPPTDGEKLDDAVGRLWVDAETELPVRVEIEGMAEANPIRWQIDFTWSAMVDPAVFELDIPPDYTPPTR